MRKILNEKESMKKKQKQNKYEKYFELKREYEKKKNRYKENPEPKREYEKN